MNADAILASYAGIEGAYQQMLAELGAEEADQDRLDALCAEIERLGAVLPDPAAAAVGDAERPALAAAAARCARLAEGCARLAGEHRDRLRLAANDQRGRDAGRAYAAPAIGDARFLDRRS